jgi:hypothetical protein
MELYNLVNNECPNYNALSSDNRTIYLLTAEGNICKEVAKFCHEALDVRKNYLMST